MPTASAWSTQAVPVAKLTPAVTPSTLSSRRSMRAAQEAHVIPVMASSTRPPSAADAVPDGGPDARDGAVIGPPSLRPRSYPEGVSLSNRGPGFGGWGVGHAQRGGL